MILETVVQTIAKRPSLAYISMLTAEKNDNLLRQGDFIAGNSNKAVSAKRKRTWINSEEFSSKRTKSSPNYFIAIPVNNYLIRNKIECIQQTIEQQNAMLKPSFIPLPTLHLTLMVMSLEDEFDISRARLALDDCRKELLCVSSFSCPVLEIRGVGHFNHSVVFTKISTDSQLKRLNMIAGTVVKCFAKHDISSTDHKAFQPHITIMKLSRASELRDKGGVSKIDPSLYKNHVSELIGSEHVGRLQLCAMHLPKDAQTGYYHIEHEVQLLT